ncbi:hypothetical protein OPQ81_010335 [Rhizoctonia solani]|nr:hypothetical protein OPQ81_010335 [Rhizoctonia solani]
MPPRSKKRVKKAPTAASDSGVEDMPLLNQSSAPSTRVVARGFLALPNELISQIISYFPEIKTAHILMNPTFIGRWENAENYFERFNVLRALSQLCRLAREIYLPLLWERFQVCLITNTKGQWFRSIGQAMERKSKGLLKSKHLWPYVKVVTVTLTRFQTSSVLPPFVKLLGALPNVHTLEIPHAHSEMTAALKEAFEGNIFPSIERVILPTCAHEILRCCPEVREVTCNEDDGGRLVSALVYNGCKKLEVLRGISAGPMLMKRLSAASPPLRCVGIAKIRWPRSIENTIPAYASFPSLRVIEVDCLENVMADDYVKIAKDTLRSCAQYKPAKKGKKSGRKPADDGHPDCELASLYNEPRTVRVRRFIKGSSSYYKQCPSHFSPVKIEQFPLEGSD